MQTCSNCGASVREGARFCTACGTQLNEASSGSSAFSWGAAIEQGVAPASGSATMQWPAATPDQAPEPSAAHEQGSETESSPTWSWDQPGDSVSTEAVDEETGIVLDTPEDVPVSGVVDATELDVLAAVPEDNAPDVVDQTAPDLSQMEDDAVRTESDDERDADSTNDQETIAAWAQEWSGDAEPSAAATAADEDDDDDPEKTVAKAERLIAELQSLVPRLARPKPVDPNQALIPQRLAEELESVTSEAQWEDLREILEKARDNPNDITYLMSVSGNAGRLLEMMEHRDSLANTASSVARRLRNPDPGQTA